MDLFGHLSYLQLLWGVQTLLLGVYALNFILSGSFFDKTQGNRSTEEKLRWFQFRKRLGLQYFYAVLLMLWLLWNVLWCYCHGSEPSARLDSLLTWATTPKRVTTDATCTLIACLLFTFHVTRRFYESWSVSVFSHRQALNPLAACIGFVNLTAAILSLLAEGQPLQGEHGYCFQFSSLGLNHLLALPLFFLGCRLQHNANLQLARLRKNRAGHIVTTDYKIPKGGWFDKVSSPHYFAEILIYVAIGLALGMRSTTWSWHVAYVITSQFFLAYSTHMYYLKRFDDYPKDRKMLIPYLL